MSDLLVVAFAVSAAILVRAVGWNVVVDGADLDRPSGKIGFVAYLAGMSALLVAVFPHLLAP